ncbi:MAG: hypothetical protein IE929_09090 [Rhizorhabdus sp.]|jgi:methyl-accepting chemotaxis protein|nr:hypothetical protein [Rhizorhabdus sp.]TAK12705.1 MAG: hypothetical protein EPO38_05990 [Rhizorhabdus sp.]
MSAIERSSEAISQIVSLIDGIALQTGLLALNAARPARRDEPVIGPLRRTA